jgi:hypothetical protein
VLGIEFTWYARQMLLPALAGYIGGIAMYWLMSNLG